MQQTVDMIEIKNIHVGDRYRKDYGDIAELAQSIRDNGIISAFAVKDVSNSRMFSLLAGGRRYKAAIEAGYTKVPCVIYAADIGELKIKEIELFENVHRKDFHFSEKAELTLQIHELEQKIHGPKTIGGPNVSGHSERDTAKMLGRSHGSVNEDINIAKALRLIPDIKKFRNRTEAVAFVKKAQQHIKAEEVKQEIAANITNTGLDEVHKQLIEQYRIVPKSLDYLKSGFFSIADTLKDEIVDMIILDPPFCLEDDVSKEIADRSGVAEEGHTWMKKENYLPMLDAYLKEAYRLLKPNSWLIVWFGPEPWFEPTYQAIIKAKFECSRNVGLWIKNKGFSHYPAYYLCNAHESFFYARKGTANIKNQHGKLNIFHYSVPHHTVRVHQTEKPVELEQDIMTTFLDPQATILVPCLGSGNSILAAANLNMTAFGYDIETQFKNGFINNVIASEPPNYRTKKGE